MPDGQMQGCVAMLSLYIDFCTSVQQGLEQRRSVRGSVSLMIHHSQQDRRIAVWRCPVPTANHVQATLPERAGVLRRDVSIGICSLLEQVYRCERIELLECDDQPRVQPLLPDFAPRQEAGNADQDGQHAEREQEEKALLAAHRSSLLDGRP